MAENESMDPAADGAAADVPMRSADDPGAVTVIDPEDERVVGAALTALVAAARHAHAAIDGNGIYPAQAAVEAVEDVVAALARITTGVTAYAGDYSKLAEKHLGRVADLLGEARSELGSARSQLPMDETLG
jgi:hypothetical protein